LPHLNKPVISEIWKLHFKLAHIHIIELLGTIMVVERGDEFGLDFTVIKFNVDLVLSLFNTKSQK